MFANGFQGGKPYRLRPARFEHGKVLGCDVHRFSQIVEAHFALSENDVEIDDNGHGLDSQFLLFLKLPSFIHDPSE